MQLISLPLSPFAARVRIAIYAKELDVEIGPPPAGWPKNPQFRSISPMGRVPVLVLEDGAAIWESAVILELLEELFPEVRALLPSNVIERAKARLLVRHADLYLMPPMVALAQPQGARETRQLAEQLVDGLTVLDGLVAGGSYGVGDELTIADCALAPALFAARVTGERLGIDLIEAAPRVVSYFRLVRQNAHVDRVLAEMDDGLRLLISTI
jgi:glutathione S-transferase